MREAGAGCPRAGPPHVGASHGGAILDALEQAGGVPVLLHGSDTRPPVPARMDALAGALPGADSAVLTAQAHFATHTAPALFAEALLNWHAARATADGPAARAAPPGS